MSENDSDWANWQWKIVDDTRKDTITACDEQTDGHN